MSNSSKYFQKQENSLIHFCRKYDKTRAFIYIIHFSTL